MGVTAILANDNDDHSKFWGTDQCDTVACRFKAPNPQTPWDVVQTWHQEDADLWEYVSNHIPHVLEHTGASAFDWHLKGVQAILRFWDAPYHLTKAGLFHSIYGTEGFQGFALPLQQRRSIQQLIGSAAEKLVFVFCMLDRSTLDQTVFEYDLTNPTTTSNNSTNNQTTFVLQSRPELGRFPIMLTKDEWLDFIELTLADWLEQVEGAALTASPIFLWDQPGVAYSYRRLAFAKMSHVLAWDMGGVRDWTKCLVDSPSVAMTCCHICGATVETITRPCRDRGTRCPHGPTRGRTR